MRIGVYDFLYRVGAPWDGPARPELVELVEAGVLTPEQLPPGRAIDLGCGTGSNAVFLAKHGFETVGVDLSRVALKKARKRIEDEGLGDRVRLVAADLTAPALPGVPGPFDLLVDYSTLDDLGPAARRDMAALIARLARPGARFLFFCFYGRRDDLPMISFTGPSRMTPIIEVGEEETLFGEHFEIERLPAPPPESREACFLMTRRAGGAR